MAENCSPSLIAVAQAQPVAQPVLGMMCAILVTSLSLTVAVLLPPSIVSGWAGLGLTAAVPTLIVQTTIWRGQPRIIERQPLRGLAGVVIMISSGAAISVLAMLAFGGGVLRPTPFVMMPLISAVPIVLWQVFLFESWPFSRLGISPVKIGLLVLATTYVATALDVHLFFDEAFLRRSSLYEPQLDPGGWFDARDVVAILIASAGGVLALAAMEFWPVRALARLLPVLSGQPGRGIAGLALALGCAVVLWAACVRGVGASIESFQSRVCVSFIFGMFVMQVMLQGSVFSGRKQPLRGLFVIAVAGLIAVAAYMLYRHAATWRGELALATKLETWISTAMLAITFPCMGVLADLFEFWPLRRRR